MIYKKNAKPGVYLVHWVGDPDPEICTVGIDDKGELWIACSRWTGSRSLAETALSKLEPFVYETKTEESKDAINPSHYKNYPIESIEMMLRVFGPTATYWHCILTAYKYRMRMGHKDDIKQELDKESWYLNKAAEIKHKFPKEIK